MAYDDYYDEEERPPRRYIIPGPTRIQPVREAMPAAPEIAGPPQPPAERIPAVVERPAPRVAPAGSSEALEAQRQQLYGQIHPLPPVGAKQRIGRIASEVGNIAGDVFIPHVMEDLPFTQLNRQLRLHGVEQRQQEALGREAKERESQATQDIERQRLALEAKKYGLPEKTGHERFNNETGEMEYGWAYPGSTEIFFKPAAEGAPAAMPTVGGAPAAPAGTVPAATRPAPTAAPQVPAAAAPPTGQPPVAAAAPKQKFTYGKPPQLSAEEQNHEAFLAAAQLPETQRTPQQRDLFDQFRGRWGKEVAVQQTDMDAGNKRMNDSWMAAQRELGPATPKPNLITKADNLDSAEKKIAEYDKQLYNERDMHKRELESQASRTLADQIKRDALEKKKQDADQEAFVSYGNLYSQDNYRNKMDAWHKSGSYARDVGLVQSVVNEAKGGGLAVSPAMTTTVGALIGGPAGAAIGGAAGILGQIIGGPAQGYLDALKRQGISNEGYEAMQAYFNALPGRMAYEITTQGLKASTMRSQILLQKVMQTIPSPDTKPEMFDRAFKQYYDPMRAMTDHKYKGRADYVPPKMEEFYPPEQPAPGAPPRGTTAPPPGARVRRFNPEKGTFE